MLTVKGSKEGLVVNIDETIELEQAKEKLKEKFESTKDFFNSGKIKIAIAAQGFTDFEICELQSVVKGILDKADITFVPFKAKEEEETNDEEPAKFYRGTVRSGQRIETEHNLIVIGDANPGSELIAGGNVIVVGSLRGLVHAGAGGNKEAVVISLNMMPTQLRIANIITRAPDDMKENPRIIPEIARIKDGTIYIEQFSTKNR